MMEKSTMPQVSFDICYNAVSLNDREAAGEDETDFQVYTSNHSESDDSYSPDQEGQEDEDEWEM